MKLIFILILVLAAIFISPVIKFMKKRKEKKQGLTESIEKNKIKKEIDKNDILKAVLQIYNHEFLEKKSIKDYNYDDLLALITQIYNHDLTPAEAFAKFIMPFEEVEQQKNN